MKRCNACDAEFSEDGPVLTITDSAGTRLFMCPDCSTKISEAYNAIYFQHEAAISARFLAEVQAGTWGKPGS